ncbi:hypothetical protein BC749_105255 [Flavobacterium araucananum]|jgi:putative salt-induced outer membrane protein YdiY|uniref:DUF3575 domain-containing protein n=1 Tax=Flavobacterium araucananum TaxID=946678 RepID=A0A227P308_9FLAO|nr:hypothetical protein [Flavobacterium araucananum]OXG03913.1 hypothetical protein B0A64_16300 [Flavobacterium araucananum]PWJ98416.1 hypothetical protein BC749_105255 [Flavobacterium araucananum]
MIKKYLFLLCSIFFMNAVQAQEDAPVSVEKNQFKINMLFPGFVYEHGFDTKNTLYSEISLGIGYSYSSYFNESNTYIFPMITEQFRHYYNLEKRMQKGKKTAHNSANYLAFNASYNFKPLSGDTPYFRYIPTFTVAALWGLQRTYKRKFNLEFNIGPGLSFANDTEIVPVGNFTLGWVIGK